MRPEPSAQRLQPRDARTSSFTAGTGYAFDESYLVVGLGANYYVVDGLNVGLHWEYWTGSEPKMSKLTPSIQYVFHQMNPVKPYVGAFYRRTYLERLEDLDSWGARAGVYLQAGRNSYVGAGVVYESYLDCNERHVPQVRQHLWGDQLHDRVLACSPPSTSRAGSTSMRTCSSRRSATRWCSARPRT